MPPTQPCLSPIIPNQLYIGNLPAALSQQLRKSIGITHILSVCPDYTSTHENHLTIAVEDSEYQDLLIHLPRACQFIENALSKGGMVLVHCVMGISRSTTAVAAYLMKSRRMDAASAIRFIRHKRPQAHPNYGFITQLVAFSACHYDPCPTNPTYRAWKRKQKQIITAYLSHIADTTPIIPDKLLMSSCFPTDPVQAEALIYELGVTHLVTISPCQIPHMIPTSTSLSEYRHFSLSDRKGDLLVTLPEACSFIRRAIDQGGIVLVHSLVESRASTVVCASLMEMKNMSPEDVLGVLEDALPLFDPSRNFSRHLELFAACGYNPTREHYLVQNWIRSQDPYYYVPPPTDSRNYPCSSSSSCGSSTMSSPTPSTPSSSVSSRTSSASSFGEEARAHVQAQAQAHHTQQTLCEGSQKEERKKRKKKGESYLVAKAMDMLSDSDANFDLSAFGQALAAIQESRAGREGL